MVPSPPSTTTISWVFRHYWRLAAEIGRFDVVDDRHFEIGAPQLFDGFLDHRAAFTQTCMRHYHRMPGTVHRKPFPRTLVHTTSSTDADAYHCNRTNERMAVAGVRTRRRRFRSFTSHVHPHPQNLFVVFPRIRRTGRMVCLCTVRHTTVYNSSRKRRPFIQTRSEERHVKPRLRRVLLQS